MHVAEVSRVLSYIVFQLSGGVIGLGQCVVTFVSFSHFVFIYQDLFCSTDVIVDLSRYIVFLVKYRSYIKVEGT